MKLCMHVNLNEVNSYYREKGSSLHPSYMVKNLEFLAIHMSEIIYMDLIRRIMTVKKTASR